MEESTRQKKVSRVIQRELGNYFQRNSTSYANGGMITVTQVRVSPDLGIAKVYLSIFAVDDKKWLIFSEHLINPSIKIEVDGDNFFSKHIAVVGSTGSG
ncbi:MAG: ribosome-binding factor A, partial [Flavobacteriales bacterium]